MSKLNDEIVMKIIEQNREGLERLADEKPARERRNVLLRWKSRLLSYFREEEKTHVIEV